MDTRAQAVFRLYKACPEDPQLKEAARGLVGRVFRKPEDRFQDDMQRGGRLERALIWEMEFSRVSIQIMPQGGLVSCHTRFGRWTTHVRIWYPTFEGLLEECLMDDIRMSVESNRKLSDTIESLEDNFPGATIVSTSVVRATSSQTPGIWQERPVRIERVDKRDLARYQAVSGSTRGRGQGLNPWVG